MTRHWRQCSFFVAKGGRLMSCGTEDDRWLQDVVEVTATGLHGHGALDADDLLVPSPTLLPTIADIRISSVSSGCWFNVAVSAAGKVYTWGSGGCLGHGDGMGRLVLTQVQALAQHPILSVAAGGYHLLAVTESGEVFSWGRDTHGQCGHGSSGQLRILPRRVYALTAARVQTASAGGLHSLVVTETGALYSFCQGGRGQLGHGGVEDKHAPTRVQALHLHIAAAAAGGEHSLALSADGSVFS